MNKNISKLLVLGAVFAVLPGCALLNNETVSDKISEGLTEGLLENMAGTDVDIDGTNDGAKSENWPSNIPTHDDGVNFTYSKWGESYILGYYVPQSSGSLNEVTDEIDAALKSAGWTTEGDTAIFESDESTFRSYSDATSTLLLTLSKDAGTTEYSVSIISGPKDATM